ncbi:MAG: tetratricopeptide repeat protein [Alphaproteobacteria bacterium]|nr:tetratricopeptide repeat protein [Alphaproteobacteria bacterium]
MKWCLSELFSVLALLAISGVSHAQEGGGICLLQAAGLGGGFSADQVIDDCGNGLTSGRLSRMGIVECYDVRASAYMQKRQYDLAIGDLNEAITLDPNYARGWGDRGAAYFAKRNFSAALADFSHALGIDRKYMGEYERSHHTIDIATIYALRGKTYAVLNDTRHAAEDYRSSLALDPGNMVATQGLEQLR